MSLATIYRPHTFKDVCSQKSIITILKRQIETENYSRCYLFCGPSGTGKTTLARIFANEINKGKGEPIEIDGASNNGVDDVRSIIKSSETRSLVGKYKIFIVDECHQITNAGWNAFLKFLEEPNEFTFIILCTTDPQKIPPTILNRVMRFNLNKIPTDDIYSRLLYICKDQKYTNYEESCNYISKLADGGMRDAIALLEKCAGYSTDLNIENVLTSLGNFSYDSFFELTNSLVDGNELEVVNKLQQFFNSGNDLKLFVEQYLDFVLDLRKYCLFENLGVTKLPNSFIDKVQYTAGFDGNVPYFKYLTAKVLDIKNSIRYDINIKTTLTIMMLNICKGYNWQ